MNKLKELIFFIFNYVFEFIINMLPNSLKFYYREFKYHYSNYSKRFAASSRPFIEKVFFFPVLLWFLSCIFLFTALPILFNFLDMPNYLVLCKEYLGLLLNNKSIIFIRQFCLTNFVCLTAFRQYTENKVVYNTILTELKNSPKNSIQLITFRFVTTAKTLKIIALTCLSCLCVVGTVDAAYQWKTGISLIREIWLGLTGEQTWLQAKEHIFNYEKYKDGLKKGITPYLQDELAKLGKKMRSK